MRIGNTTNNNFFLQLNEINKDVQDRFFKKIVDETKSVECSVMLGDSTTKMYKHLILKIWRHFLGVLNLNYPNGILKE